MTTTGLKARASANSAARGYRVAIVHDWLTGMRVGEKCLAVLCRLFPDAPLFTLLHRRGATAAAIERMTINTSFLQRIPGIAHHYRYWLPLMPRAIESLQVPYGTDLVLSFSHAVAKGVRVPPGVPHVCFCFTPMRYAWHLRDDYLGRENTGGIRGWRASANFFRHLLLDRMRRWDRDTSDRVTHYVAVSKTVARRIWECYGRESAVIYPPVDTAFFTPDDATAREDWYLCLSALVPYKRVDLAIEACRQVGRRLIVIGDGPERASLCRRGGSHVEFLGWRTDHEVRDRLRRCRALLFPGQEDFGIVPVEAQACGAPVIAYARGGVLETVLPGSGQAAGTGILFAEQTPRSLADAMLRYEAHPAICSPELARARAESFSLSRYEREMLAFLDSVVDATAPRVRAA